MDDRGYKVKDVVNGANLNPRTMSDYLSAKRPLSANDALAIARFLGVKVEDLS